MVIGLFSKKIERAAMFALALVCAAIWLGRSYKFNNTKATANTDTMEIVFWNAQHNKRFLDAFKVNSRIPDVLVMVEYDRKKINKAIEKYPNYHFRIANDESIGIFSKTPITVNSIKTHEDFSTVVNFKTNGLNFYAVDITASYLSFRKESLQFAYSHILKKDNSIVLGDFNTPIESYHFSFLKNNFTNAFNQKGNGFRETWPWNMPLLMLDHIWVSKDITILNTEKIHTLQSDHSLIRAVVSK
ncbi:hypothetical protein MHTCC0001_09110 [Flavobacteriaceae bacterium MHTCC 0001]